MDRTPSTREVKMKLKRKPRTKEEKDWIRGYNSSAILWRMQHDFLDDRTPNPEGFTESFSQANKEWEKLVSEICTKYNLIDPYKKEPGTATITFKEWVNKLGKELIVDWPKG